MDGSYQRQQGECALLVTLHLTASFKRLTFACPDTILSWQDPETGIDYALSFQEPDGCTEVWEQIVSVQNRAREAQRHLEQSAAALHAGQQTDDEQAAPQGGAPGCAPGVPPLEPLALPACELRNLSTIAQLLGEVAIVRRAKVAEVLLQNEYIPQLVALFATAEDLESAEDLAHLFTIFKGIVLLNSTAVYEMLLREDILMGVIGALEYDPELRCHSVQHRAFLREVACFRQVVPFSDAAVMKKVRQNFLLGFLKVSEHAALCACS